MSDFLLITLGSHGDVHPFVGIGRDLAARGHRVRLAANDIFRPMVEQAGLEFITCGDREVFTKVLSNRDVWHHQRGPKVILESVGESLQQVYDLVTREAGAGTFVVGSSLALGARCAAEKHRLAMATIHLAPICIRSHETMPVLPGGIDVNYLPRAWRKRFWEGADRFVIDPLILPKLNPFRVSIGLPPVERFQAGWWSAPLLTIGLWPAWFLPRQPDYPPQVRLAGFPLYDESDHVALDDDLEAFLAAGAPPVAFTPGSAMVFGHKFFAAAVDACRRLGRRGLLVTRHAQHLPVRLPPFVRHVPFAPFGLLLPRCAAIVHHGGIGTTAQGLRAAIPQLIMPMSHDQPDNAAICRRLGVAAAVRPAFFTGWNVARKLHRLLNSPDVARACEAVAACARGDDPAAASALLIAAADAAEKNASLMPVGAGQTAV
jgi:UDP:flavonoid glycosyltransferase YjiC (YdhE family)